MSFILWFLKICCFFVSLSEILNSKTLPQPTKREETVFWYPWTINNKYYTADVQLCVVPSTYQMSSEIAQSMQAFIAYFDSKVVCDLKNIVYFSTANLALFAVSVIYGLNLQKDGLEKLNTWIPVVEDLSPEVLILVCDRVCENGSLKESITVQEMHIYTLTPDTASASLWGLIYALGVTRHEAQQWCLSHAFELVELNPQELPDEDGEFHMKEKSTSIWKCLNLIHCSSLTVVCTFQMTFQSPQEWRELFRLLMPTCGPVWRWKMVNEYQISLVW